MLSTQLPILRADLVIVPIGNDGRYVVKNPHENEFFQIGEEERFLLDQFDGKQDAEQICSAFEEKFAESLAVDDLDEFLEMARAQGLLETEENGKPKAVNAPAESAEYPVAPSPAHPLTSPRKKKRQSILYWRKSLFDPDRFFDWLEPKIRFCWTKGFLAFSAGCIVAATLVLWAGRQSMVSSFHDAWRWETVLLAWLMLLLVGVLHEFAHGLTCKHYGGEVREIGFLLMYFMPCFYCNVSDVWLFREKSKRLWVTFAGGYFELFVWALSVFVWRISVPDSLVNYLAFIVLTLSGIDSFFNFNPLIKLDGYYLLSDWLEIPNLQQRSQEYAMGRLRLLLWGADAAERSARGGLLLGFGLASWIYSLMIVGLMVFAMSRYVGTLLGPFGFGVVAVMGLVSMRGLFRGLLAGEMKTMLIQRHKRTAMWGISLGVVAAVLGYVEIEDRASGPCEIRSARRAEIRAPLTGFIREVYVEQGDRLSPGTPIARLEIPELESQLSGKQAEVREAEAQLRLLQAGARPEAIVEQRQRVRRTESWRDRAQHDLKQEGLAHAADLARLEQKAAECRIELEAAQHDYDRAEKLIAQGVVTEDQLLDAESHLHICRARLKYAESDRRATAARGTLQAEAELARREQELAEARSALLLLEAGSRPDEITAARARLNRLQEEARHLESLQEQLQIVSPITGVASTSRLPEQVGRYVAEGELICTVEDPENLIAEISLAEDAIERIRVDQDVHLKVRGLPYETFRSQALRIAPVVVSTTADSQTAIADSVSGTVSVRCPLPNESRMLKPGMTGYARISTGRRTLGRYLGDRAVRFLRTEFWW